MLQAAVGDDGKSSRKETLKCEIDQALEKFTLTERIERKEALKVYFPAWNQIEIKTVEVTKWTAPRKPTPDEALAVLKDCAKDLSEAQRQDFSQQLFAAGYKVNRTEAKPPPASGSFGAVPESTAKKLGLKQPASVSPERVFVVLEETVDCLTKLSEAARTIVLRLYDGATMEKPPKEEDSALRAVIGRYLSGDPAVTPEKMREALSKARRRLGSSMQLPGALPALICERLKMNFDPAAIKALAERQGGGNFWRASEIGYWETYERLWTLKQLGFIEHSEFWDVCFARDVISILERNE